MATEHRAFQYSTRLTTFVQPNSSFSILRTYTYARRTTPLLCSLRAKWPLAFVALLVLFQTFRCTFEYNNISLQRQLVQLCNSFWSSSFLMIIYDFKAATGRLSKSGHFSSRKHQQANGVSDQSMPISAAMYCFRHKRCVYSTLIGINIKIRNDLRNILFFHQFLMWEVCYTHDQRQWIWCSRLFISNDRRRVEARRRRPRAMADVDRRAHTGHVRAGRGLLRTRWHCELSAVIWQYIACGHSVSRFYHGCDFIELSRCIMRVLLRLTSNIWVNQLCRYRSPHLQECPDDMLCQREGPGLYACVCRDPNFVKMEALTVISGVQEAVMVCCVVMKTWKRYNSLLQMFLMK